MSELTCLELSVLLWVAHVLTQSVTARAEFGLAYSFSPRDAQPTPQGLAWGRATRALNNYVENLAPFVALALALIATGHTGGRPGDDNGARPDRFERRFRMFIATSFIKVLRRPLESALYLPIYVMGVIYVRTALWGVAVIGLLMMLVRLAWS
jgi:uncharacterized MAPEG superfamily protein